MVVKYGSNHSDNCSGFCSSDSGPEPLTNPTPRVSLTALTAVSIHHPIIPHSLAIVVL